MSIRNFLNTKIIHQTQEADVATVLQNENLNLYQFDVCCDISLAYTSKFLEEHPEITERIQRLFEDTSTHHLQKKLKERFEKEKDTEGLKQAYNAIANKGSATYAEDYRSKQLDPYLIVPEIDVPEDVTEYGLARMVSARKGLSVVANKFNIAADIHSVRKWLESASDEDLEKWCEACREALGVTDEPDYFKERATAAEKLNKLFDFEGKFADTVQRTKELPGEKCYEICMTPIEQIEAYVQAQNLREVLETYYDQTSFLAERRDNDLFYTYLHGDNAFAYAEKALSMIGKYRNCPEFEKMIEDKTAALISMQTIDGQERSFSYFSRSGVSAFRRHMAEAALKDPTSEDSLFYFEHEENVFKQDVDNHNGSSEMYAQIAAAHPDLFEGIESYDAAGFAKLYDKSHDERLVPILTAKVKGMKHKDGTLPLEAKVLAYTYAEITGNKELKEMAVMPIDELRISGKALRVFKDDVDYQPLFEELWGADKDKIIIENITQEDTKTKPFRNLISENPYLREIEFNDRNEIEIDAKSLLNPNLKKINLGYIVVSNIEELIELLPDMEEIASWTDKNTDKIYASLMKKRPEKLERVHIRDKNGESYQLMRKYPDLLVNDSDRSRSDLQWRNAAIVSAKKSKDINDVISVVYHKGIVEYLELIDEKDRPSFEDLSNKKEEYPYKNCFDVMKEKYGDQYLATLAVVAGLCGLTEIKKEAAIREAVQEVRVLEYLSTAKPEDWPTFEDLNKKSELFGEKSCFELMRDQYGEGYIDVLAEVAVLCGLSEIKKEAELLKAAKDKSVAEHIMSIKEDKRPTFASLCAPTICTNDGRSVIDQIKKSYNEEEYANVMADILSLTKATKEDMQSLEGDEKFGEIVKQYAKRQQREQNVAASKSAFEKCKQEREK